MNTLSPRIAVSLLTLAALALLAGAWWFQLVMGLLPCKLCLEQRWPHYGAAVLGIATLAAGLADVRLERPALVILGLIFVISALMGGYHAGVEWGWFAGPNDCGGAAPPAAASTTDFLRQLQTTRVVSCTEAAWRWLGLSLAGWNALISVALAALAALAVHSARTAHGSSSVSQ